MTRRQRHLSTVEKALTLIRIRSEAAICTYLAIKSADTSGLVADAAREFDGAEALPRGVLPGIRTLAARELGAAPVRAIAILGITEGRAWATWHLPVEPPQVPT